MKLFNYIPIITKLINKRHRFKIRATNKGYKKLRKECKLFVLPQLKDLLSKTKLNN